MTIPVRPAARSHGPSCWRSRPARGGGTSRNATECLFCRMALGVFASVSAALTRREQLMSWRGSWIRYKGGRAGREAAHILVSSPTPWLPPLPPRRIRRFFRRSPSRSPRTVMVFPWIWSLRVARSDGLPDCRARGGGSRSRLPGQSYWTPAAFQSDQRLAHSVGSRPP